MYLHVYVLLQRLHTKLNTLAAGSCESVLSQFMLRGTREADKNEGSRPGPYFRPKSNKKRKGKKKKGGGGAVAPLDVFIIELIKPLLCKEHKLSVI